MGAFSDSEKNRMLDATTGRATMTANAGYFAKLHTGSPGAAGTSNASSETTRQAVAFGVAPSAGAIASSAQVQWTNLALGGQETITHVSFWTASSGGTFVGADDLPSSKVVQPGDTLTIASGDVQLSVTGTLP